MTSRSITLRCAACDAVILTLEESAMRGQRATTKVLMVQAVRKHNHGDSVRFFVAGTEMLSAEDVMRDADERRVQSDMEKVMGLR